MTNDEYSAVPAGWYPDPLGLPQLRWWDNHAWTEHVAEARQPMVAHESRTTKTTEYAWPEDDTASRRERREREKNGRIDTGKPLAQSLRELPAPRAHTRQEDEPAPAASQASDSYPGTGYSTDYSTDGYSSDNYGSRPDQGYANENWSYSQQQTSYQPATGDLKDWSAGYGQSSYTIQGTTDGYGYPQTQTQTQTAPEPAETPAPVAAVQAHWVHTPYVWAIALLPMLQLLLTLVFVSSAEVAIPTAVFMAIWIAPYFAVIVLAFFDQRLLRRAGLENPASWRWALATPPAYLLARAARTVRKSGRGFSPLVIWSLLGVLLLGAIVAVPGIVIAQFPDVFRAAAAASIERDAALIPNVEALEVTCRAAPPTVIGQSFGCLGIDEDGDSYLVKVSLQRLNGWIDWQVDDYGAFNTGAR